MEGLDFRSMSRRDLQALCKKHGIPANSTNALMADRLAAFFSKKVKEGPRPVGPSCLKGSGGSGDLQGEGCCTRSKRKRVKFLLPEGDPDLGEAGDRYDPSGEELPEPAAAVAVVAPRLTRSRALRLQEDTETAIVRSDVGRTRSGARTLKNPNVGRNSATAVTQVYLDRMVDEGLMNLRHRLRGVVTHADGATKRSRRLRDPGLTEEIGAVAAAAAAPAAVPVPEVPENIGVGRRRGSRKHHQDPVLVLPTSPQGSAPATENVARGGSETGGPRRSKRNHRNPEFDMAGDGASKISAAEIPDVGVEAEKEGSVQILECQRGRKSVRFRSSEKIGDGVHKDAVGEKLQKQAWKNAPEPADEGTSALACESKNRHGASSNAKKSKVPQSGEHLRGSRRNVRKKSVPDILPTEGANSEDDYGRVAGAVLPTKQNIQRTRRGAAFARENGKITGSLEVQENSTKVSDYDEPTKRKRRRSVRCGDAEQKVPLPQSEKPGNDKDLVDKKCCSWERKTQRSDRDFPETFPFSDSIFDGNVVMGDVQNSAEPSQLGEIAKEAKYQGSEDISKQEEMAGGVVQDVAHGPTDSLLTIDVPLEKPKTGTTEPDRRGIQHEEHDKPEEDREKFELKSFKEDSPVNHMGSPAVAKKSHGSCDQEQKEDLPGFSPSIMKDTVEHSHTHKKASVRESSDGEVQSSFKESSGKASCSYQCPEEDVGPNEKPDCAQLSENVIDDPNGKTFADMMEMQSSPTHGLSSASEAYNQGCNLNLEITAVGDDAPFSNSFKETRIEDVNKSPLVDDQGCNLNLEITAVGDDAPLSNSFKETRIEDVNKSPLVDDQGTYSQSLKEDSEVNCMGSPAVTKKSHGSCDQEQKEILPCFSPSIMKDAVEHSHANQKVSVRKSCDGEVLSSFKESSGNASYSYQCPEEDVVPNEKLDCVKLSEHVIDDPDCKTSADMMEMQSSPTHGLSSLSEAYNQGCNLTLEITAVGDDAPLSNCFKETRIEDAAKSPLVDDQGSVSHYYLSGLLMGNKNKDVPVEASETMSSAETLMIGGKFSPGSDGMHAFCTHSLSCNLDVQGSELNGNSPLSSLVPSGEETVRDEAVAATLPRVWLLEKECESSSHTNDHEVDFAEADDLCGSHAFPNASEVVQELACDVDTKENIEVDVNGNFSGQSFSLFDASENTANLLDKTEGRQRNQEPYAPTRNSLCDTAPLDIASIASNPLVSRHLVDINIGDFHTGIELPDSPNEAGFLAEGTSSGPKSLEKSLPSQTEDKCILNESGEILTSEDGAIKFFDTTQFSAEKQLKLDEHEESMEAIAFTRDTVLRVSEISTQTESKEEKVAADSKRSREASLNGHPKEGSFDNNLGETLEATPDAHESVISRHKFANKVADTEDVEGELSYAVSFSGYQEAVTSAVRDLHKPAKLQNENILVTQEAEDGSIQESLVRGLASGGQFTVQMRPHPTVCDEGVELTDVQETGRSPEVLDVVVAAQLDEELSSSQRISSELLTVSADVDVACLSDHKPLCQTYNLSHNGCHAGDTVVESQHPFPDNASDKIVEVRTEPADLLVTTSSVKVGRPVLNETGPLLDKIAYNEECSEDKKNSLTNIEESGYMDSYRTTERKRCGLGLDKHRETVESIKDTVGSAEMLGTEISGWTEKTDGEGENVYQSTRELEETETMEDQLGHIHTLSAVKTPDVQGTGLDGKCTAGADESCFQIGKLLPEESVIPPIWPTNGGEMNRSTKSPELSFLETECDVCEIATTETCLSSNDRDNDRLLELSQLGDVNSASAEILKFSPIIQVISPDCRTDNCILQLKERTIKHNSSDETWFQVLCTEKSVCRHGFVDLSGNEKKDEKLDGDLSEHNPSYETYLEVPQSQKSAGTNDFTVSSENEQEHYNPSGDIFEHNLSYETCPEFMQTENAVGGHDFIDNGEIEKEVDKLDGDVSENNSGHETCLGAPLTENSVGGHGFINLSENEKEDNKPNRDVPEHKSNYVTYSEGIQTENVGRHNFVDHGENEQEDDQLNRYVSKQELSSEEVSVKEKRDNRNDKLGVVTPGGLVSVEREVNQLKGEKPEQILSSFYQSEEYGTANLMPANDFKDHKELGNKDNRSNVGLPEEEPEHKAEYRHLLQQNKDTMGRAGLLICFEPKSLADEGRFDGNLKHDIKSYTSGTVMRFAELEDIKHEDVSSNICSSTSDDNYFPNAEAPAVEISLEDIQITLTQRPDIGANLEHVSGNWDWKNTVKDMNHEEVAGTVQDQEADEMWTEEPETWQQKEDLQYVNGFDSPYCQDTKDGLTYREHDAVVSYSVKAHNLGNILEATKDSKSPNRLEDVSRELNDHCASIMCTTNEDGQEQSICKSTGNYTRQDKGEVPEFYRNTQSLDEMHLSGMEIDGNDEEEKLQLASFEELVVDTDAAVGNNGDNGEHPSVSMNSTCANFLGESDSACDLPLDIGKTEDGALVNHSSYAALLDGRKQTPPNLAFAYEVFPESAILSELEHFALDGTCADDKHDSAKETTMVVANDMNTLTLHNVDEENCCPRKGAATTTSDCASCQVEDTVGSLAEVEEINDIVGGIRISSARNHTTTGRISCTTHRNQSSKIFHDENGQGNTPFSKVTHSANIFVEKSTVQTSKRKALANLQNRIHKD